MTEPELFRVSETPEQREARIDAEAAINEEPGALVQQAIARITGNAHAKLLPHRSSVIEDSDLDLSIRDRRDPQDGKE